ncbi:MAG: RNA polymerase sigma factor [Clostridia bacterium]|nr:RNA polymerase sigma factor [Clostridia bacterium]
MNSEEFAARVEAMRSMLYRICCMQLYEPADREDAIQEAIFKAWKKRSSLREPRYFNTWFIRILINECRNIQKRRKRSLPLVITPETMGNSGFEGQDLRMSLAALDEKLRICILLHYLEGYSVREVSRILGISENAVKARLMRGRKRLKELLSEEVFGE